MPRPPASVVFVARTHWAVGAVMAVSMAALHLVFARVPLITFGPRTYAIAGGLAGLYLVAGTLVWFGSPFGRLLSRIAGLLYLVRPQFGSPIWETMSLPEFRSHFR